MTTETETDTEARWSAIADRVPDKIDSAGRELCLQLVPAIAAREGAWTASRPATQMLCTEICRLARRHHKLAEDACNYGGDEAASERVEERITELVEALPQWLDTSCEHEGAPCVGRFGALFQGDPRGCTVKLTGPRSVYDSWGNDGVCVPQ